MSRTGHIVMLGIVFGVCSSCAGSRPAPTASSASPQVDPAPVTVELAPPPESAPSAEAPPAEPAPAPAPATAWKDMSGEQKMSRMKRVVLPDMAARFKKFDEKDFASISCKTCHGRGAELGSFAMPNADLPKLDPANGFAAAKKTDAAMVEFMMSEVTPQMARFLDMSPYDPTTKQGFGCFGCHTMKK